MKLSELPIGYVARMIKALNERDYGSEFAVVYAGLMPQVHEKFLVQLRCLQFIPATHMLQEVGGHLAGEIFMIAFIMVKAADGLHEI